MPPDKTLINYPPNLDPTGSDLKKRTQDKTLDAHLTDCDVTIQCKIQSIIQGNTQSITVCIKCEKRSPYLR